MAAEQNTISGLTQRVVLLENVLGETRTAIDGLTAQLTAVQSTTVRLGDGLEQTSAQMAGYAANLEAEKKNLINDLNEEFDKHKVVLTGVVEGARMEFGTLKAFLQNLHDKTATTFEEVRNRFNELQDEIAGGKNADTQGSRSTGGMNGFLPAKALVPPVFKGEEEKWRAWQEDMADYLDGQRRGLKAVMKDAEKEPNPITDAWVNARGIDAMTHSINLYRALKALTLSEARMVVQGIKDECGFEAWRALHQRFGPSVAARQGRVMHDLSHMVSKPARTPAETRSLVTELERRIRVAEDVTGETLGDGHIKSILAAILDPVTRAHTSAFQGSATKYHELKRVVLEFANNTSVMAKDGGGSEPMNIGACTSHTDHQDALSFADITGRAADEDEWEHIDGQISAVSAGTQCHTCGGFGHIAAKCPTPKTGKGKGHSGAGKGDAKGKGKTNNSSGKTKGNGPKGGCWTCGGAHFASDCHLAGASGGGKAEWGGKGKGGKGKGVNFFNIHDQYWPEPSVRPLCGLSTIAPKHAIRVKNRFAALQEQDEEPDVTPSETPTLPMKIVPKPPSQGERKRATKATAPAAAPCLNPLATIEPEGLAPVSAVSDGWEAVEMAVDSGASETVIPEKMVTGALLQPSPASRRGVEYEVANGHRIPNLGQKTFTGVTPEGTRRSVTAQVCDVNKGLMSVAKLVNAGHTVVFAREGSRIIDDATGETIELHQSGGMYMLRMWVPTNADGPASVF